MSWSGLASTGNQHAPFLLSHYNKAPSTTADLVGNSAVYLSKEAARSAQAPNQLADLVARYIKEGNGYAAAKLLDYNCLSPDTLTRAGENALHTASRLGNEPFVSLLLSYKVNVDCATSSLIGGLTALHLAAANNHPAIALRLALHGASVNAKSIRGATPLILAASRGHHAVVEVLLAAGADASIADGLGLTAFTHARHAMHYRTMGLIAQAPPPAAAAAGVDAGAAGSRTTGASASTSASAAAAAAATAAAAASAVQRPPVVIYAPTVPVRYRPSTAAPHRSGGPAVGAAVGGATTNAAELAAFLAPASSSSSSSSSSSFSTSSSAAAALVLADAAALDVDVAAGAASARAPGATAAAPPSASPPADAASVSLPGGLLSLGARVRPQTAPTWGRRPHPAVTRPAPLDPFAARGALSVAPQGLLQSVALARSTMGGHSMMGLGVVGSRLGAAWGGEAAAHAQGAPLGSLAVGDSVAMLVHAARPRAVHIPQTQARLHEVGAFRRGAAQEAAVILGETQTLAQRIAAMPAPKSKKGAAAAAAGAGKSGRKR